MGKINGCLKCIFIFFNVLFVLLGCALIYGAVKSEVYKDQMAAAGGPSSGWAWVFAFGVLLLSILGVVAGCLEKELVLKVFAGFMVVGMLIMLIYGIIVAVYRNKVRDGFESTSSLLVDQFMEKEEFKQFLISIQDTLHCCGVGSYADWKTDTDSKLPKSCSCDDQSPWGCMARPQGFSGPDQINKQSCGSILFHVFDIFFKLGMGFCFGFAVIALLGFLVSLLMIWQVRRHDSGTIGQSIAMKG